MSGRPEISLVALGGLGEFGRNVLWISCGGSNVIVDAGVSFPDETFPGIDRIAPDLSPLKNVHIDAVLLTHGHEDHVGSLPLLAEWCEAPVHGLPFTLALARRRLEEAGASLERLVEVRRGETVRAGGFDFTFFRVSHSVPDSAAILIEAGGWRLFHSGDFKLDPDPPDGETTDVEGIAAATAPGVDLALVDSTNAERPGRASSERVAGAGLSAAFAGARGRIVMTTFSSHVARISQAVDAAMAEGRRVAILGRSMRTIAEIAERFRRLQIPTVSRIFPPDLAEAPGSKVLCLMGGSQGEPFSALYRLALDEHSDLKLDAGDLVLFSSRTIPGHERSVNRVTDHLVRRGARVLRETEPPIHVSGHAHRDDIADWLALVRPRAVLPVHGERRMLAAVAE
ncbi:MAG TPA: ribonuclease J, partial [Thermoanaerobaculia bacterium]